MVVSAITWRDLSWSPWRVCYVVAFKFILRNFIIVEVGLSFYTIRYKTANYNGCWMLFASGSEREQANSFILAWVYQLFKSQRLEKRSFQRQRGKMQGGYSTEFNTGRLHPSVKPLILWYTIFDRKGTPFVYPLLTNGSPFTYLDYSFASFQTAVNAVSLKYE